jgi:hypothetical protein
LRAQQLVERRHLVRHRGRRAQRLQLLLRTAHRLGCLRHRIVGRLRRLLRAAPGGIAAPAQIAAPPHLGCRAGGALAQLTLRAGNGLDVVL